MARTDVVRALAEPIVAALGHELYDVEENSATIRLLIDSPDGAGIRDLAKITRLLSDALDESDPISGSYTLEVSSPGVERPLRRPEHFERVIGSAITVKTLPGVEGDRRVTGVLTAVDTSGITVTGPDGAEREIQHVDISKARTVYDADADLRAAKQQGVPSDSNLSTQKVDAP